MHIILRAETNYAFVELGRSCLVTDPKAVFFLKYGWLEENYGGLFG
jgi:hypothetical protein